MQSKHILIIEADQAEDATVERFKNIITIAHAVIFDKLAPEAVEATKIKVILAKDFSQAINQAWNAQTAGNIQGPDFSPERLGGQVVAKTIDMNPEFSEIHIIFAQDMWMDESDLGSILNLNTAIHEIAHALLGRIRWQSGVLSGVIFPSQTPSEYARSITRTAAEEYWVDVLAGLAIGACATVSHDDTTRPITPPDLLGGTGAIYRAQFATLLDSHIHPGWANEVNRYRHWKQSLKALWETIVSGTDQIITLLAHCEAEAYFLGRLGPLEDECSDHPGAKLYLGPAWKEINTLIKDRPLDLTLEGFAECELKLLEVGEKALIDMWGRLGLTFEEYADRNFHLHVSNPIS